MPSRLDNIPVYELIKTSVPAEDFNRVQIAFKRLGCPLHIPLSGLRSLELVLEHDAWIVIDNALNDIPVLAWTDFQTEGRPSLHEPIRCLLKTYHIHAQVILQKIVAYMQQELAKYLSEKQTVCKLENITPLQKD